MDKHQIITAIAGKYRASYAVYDILEQLSKQATRDGDTTAYRVFSRQAGFESSFLAGLKAAALGVDAVELMAAVNSDKEVAKQ